MNEHLHFQDRSPDTWDLMVTCLLYDHKSTLRRAFESKIWVIFWILSALCGENEEEIEDGFWGELLTIVPVSRGQLGKKPEKEIFITSTEWKERVTAGGHGHCKAESATADCMHKWLHEHCKALRFLDLEDLAIPSRIASKRKSLSPMKYIFRLRVKEPQKQCISLRAPSFLSLNIFLIKDYLVLFNVILVEIIKILQVSFDDG